jgi:transcription elongation factor Elf1
MTKKKTAKKPKKKRKDALKEVQKMQTPCPHCNAMDSYKASHIYSNGNRRAVCGICEKPFILRK